MQYQDPYKTRFEDDRVSGNTINVGNLDDINTVFEGQGGNNYGGGDSRTEFVMPGGEGSDSESLAVGWVVVISGPMRGQSHTLRLGRNFIGSGRQNDIVLPKDKGISETNAVSIAYVPQTHAYYAGAGMGHMFASLNDEPILMTVPLKAGDNIRLSKDTVLRFVPCCFDGFFWEDEAK